jgi:ketosteroid isomerase-like protein
MSQENVETALAAMEAWTRRDVEALLAFLDPEIEWHPALQTLLGGEAAVYRGHDGVRELIRDLDEVASSLQPVVSELHDLGDRVAAVVGWQSVAARAASRSTLQGESSRTSARARSSASVPTSTPRRPSKPWGCRSSGRPYRRRGGTRIRSDPAPPPASTAT